MLASNVHFPDFSVFLFCVWQAYSLDFVAAAVAAVAELEDNSSMRSCPAAVAAGDFPRNWPTRGPVLYYSCSWRWESYLWDSRRHAAADAAVASRAPGIWPVCRTPAWPSPGLCLLGEDWRLSGVDADADAGGARRERAATATMLPRLIFHLKSWLGTLLFCFAWIKFLFFSFLFVFVCLCVLLNSYYAKINDEQKKNNHKIYQNSEFRIASLIRIYRWVRGVEITISSLLLLFSFEIDEVFCRGQIKNATKKTHTHTKQKLKYLFRVRHNFSCCFS